MLRARIMKLREDKDCAKEEQAAFQLLRDGLLGVMNERKSHPTLNVYSDQIVWSRSPVRIDVAGGWTDTPPYSLYSGGSVVNLAPPRRCKYTLNLARNIILPFVPSTWVQWK